MNTRLAKQLLGHKRPLAVMLSAHVVAALLVIVQAVLLTRVITDVFLHRQAGRALLPAALLLISVTLGRSLILWIVDLAASRLGAAVKHELRQRLFRHILALGPAYSNNEKVGELVTTTMDGVDQVEVYLSRYLPQLVVAALVPLSLCSYILLSDWMSGVILLVTGPLIPFFMVLIGRSAENVTRRQWRLLSVLGGHFLDVLRGLPTLRLYNRSHRQVAVIEAISDAYRKTTIKSLRIAFLSALVLELLATLSTAMVAVGLSLRLMSGALSFTTAFTVLLLTPEFFLPIRALGSEFHAGLGGITAAARVFAILDTRPQGLLDAASGRRLTHGVHSIEFDHVTFTHGDTPVLDDVSFTIHAGETAVLVGASGSGKTTILDLLLGFIRPTQGRILIDGVPHSDLSMHWWREEVSVVTQHTHLFAGTLLDNIQIASPGSDAAQALAAARTCGVERFVQALPDAWSTLVGEGAARLSGGQLQRIALARAVLRDSPVWLLDEPTAHLDVDSAAEVERVIASMQSDRTLIVSTHDLWLADLADVVLVIADQGVTERRSAVPRIRGRVGRDEYALIREVDAG